ncbi:MAG: 3-deoxy-D-manno-octulosonic acid transferase [Myxococcales bacterium]|nr:3-deoxy-D-manno-octulosonic acid transferase [Myxococcales bacterium]
MIWLYSALLWVVVVLVGPILLAIAALSSRGRAGLGERLRPLGRALEHAGSGVWVHAASVGEVEAGVPLIQGLLDRGIPVVATTATTTGRARMRQYFPGLRVRLAPLEIPGLATASVRRARIALLVLLETELWPALITGAARGGARVVVVGARISDRSLPRYRLLRPLLAPVLGCLNAVGAQTELHADRFRALGVPRERVSIVGDPKFDRPLPEAVPAELDAALGPGPLLVGGSTHPGEEEALLAAWAALREQGARELRLVLAPRHPDRAGQVLAAARRKQASARLRSEGPGDADVVVLDTLGELAAVYLRADLVFVGGTLAPVGGHNLIEPAAAGRVVVAGPHTENQRHQVALLESLGVLRQVADARGLELELGGLWADPDRNRPAERARTVLAAHCGAVERSLALMLGELQAAGGLGALGANGA